MKTVTFKPHLQVWVCVNERPTGPSQLPSCGLARGQAVFTSAQRHFSALAHQLGMVIWTNRTLCQGFCHEAGVTVLIEPLGLRWQGVQLNDLPTVVEAVRSALQGARR